MQILLFMADLTAVNSFTDAVKWSWLGTAKSANLLTITGDTVILSNDFAGKWVCE